MEMYAGHYINEDKNRISASGGAATVLAETVIRMGGMVYGVVYESDFCSARFDFADNIEDLEKFKGSKYFAVSRIVLRNGEKVGLFKDVADMLRAGKIVLLIGLGCDIGNMYQYISKYNIDDEKLYTVELICDGVTPGIVQREYITAMEKTYGSKVIQFNLRHKCDNWIPSYIYIKFENGIEVKKRFDLSEYSYAFYNYKAKTCFECIYKGIGNHVANIAIGDFWGCVDGMEVYDSTGVSLIIVQNEKGQDIINEIDKKEFYLNTIDMAYALHNQPSYLKAHTLNEEWKILDRNISQIGLMETVHNVWKKTMPVRLKNKIYNKLVVWGAGGMFRTNFNEIESINRIDYVCDGDSSRWGEFINGKEIVSPQRLTEEKEVFVLIVIENPSARVAVVNTLLDMKIDDFDFFENWLKYAKKMLYGSNQDIV